MSIPAAPPKETLRQLTPELTELKFSIPEPCRKKLDELLANNSYESGPGSPSADGGVNLWKAYDPAAGHLPQAYVVKAHGDRCGGTPTEGAKKIVDYINK